MVSVTDGAKAVAIYYVVSLALVFGTVLVYMFVGGISWYVFGSQEFFGFSLFEAFQAIIGIWMFMIFIPILLTGSILVLLYDSIIVAIGNIGIQIFVGLINDFWVTITGGNYLIYAEGIKETFKPIGLNNFVSAMNTIIITANSFFSGFGFGFTPTTPTTPTNPVAVG